MFVKAVNREHRIPFETKVDDPFYSTSNQLHLMRSIYQLKNGKALYTTLLRITMSDKIRFSDAW